jgi:iron complex transport system ATP-binding protein
MSLSEPLVDVQDVSFGYRSGRLRVLRNLSLQVVRSSVTAILGPNGVGKTTLLHIILGWLKPWDGRINLAGVPLQSYSLRERGRLMSLVPQKEHIPFEYSMIEYVMLGRVPYLRPLEIPGREDERIAAEALYMVGLSPDERRPITQMSGGERQLLLIARSLAQQPRLLLLDEPTVHLDLRNKKIMVKLLREQVRRGVSVLLTTHDPDVAVALADRVVLVRDGRVMKEGVLSEMLTSELLTATYGSEVEVREVRGKRVALWF